MLASQRMYDVAKMSTNTDRYNQHEAKNLDLFIMSVIPFCQTQDGEKNSSRRRKANDCCDSRFETFFCRKHIPLGRSSNGRTRRSGRRYLGSNPSLPAKNIRSKYVSRTTPHNSARARYAPSSWHHRNTLVSFCIPQRAVRCSFAHRRTSAGHRHHTKSACHH